MAIEEKYFTDGRIGFEAEFVNIQYSEKKKEILLQDLEKFLGKEGGNKLPKNLLSFMILNTDSPSGKGFNIEFTSRTPYLVSNLYQGITLYKMAQDIVKIIDEINKKIDPIKEYAGGYFSSQSQELVEVTKPQITFQIGLEFMPFLLKHLYIVTGFEEFFTSERKEALLSYTYLNKIDGFLALFDLYIKNIFQDKPIVSDAGPNLKPRVSVMSRFSFSKMFNFLTEKEKVAIIGEIQKIYKDTFAYDNKIPIIYKDYNKPTNSLALIISIRDWVDTIQSPNIGIKKIDALELTKIRENLEKKLPNKFQFNQRQSRQRLERQIEKINSILSNEIKVITYPQDSKRDYDILSPPPNLGKPRKETGMGAGDLFEDLQEFSYGDGLVEVRLYSRFIKPLGLKQFSIAKNL